MFNKILIPTDGSTLGDIAAMEGLEMAAKMGAEVVFVHVVREYPAFASKNSASVEEYESTMFKDAENVLKPFKEAATKTNIKFTTIIRFANHIAQAILRVARECNCSLIFIGSNGCGGWDHILMGSVTSKVLSMAEIPVLVYRLKKEEVPGGTPYYYETVFPA